MIYSSNWCGKEISEHMKLTADIEQHMHIAGEHIRYISEKAPGIHVEQTIFSCTYDISI